MAAPAGGLHSLVQDPPRLGGPRARQPSSLSSGNLPADLALPTGGQFLRAVQSTGTAEAGPFYFWRAILVAKKNYAEMKTDQVLNSLVRASGWLFHL